MLRTKLVPVTIAILSIFVVLPAIACHRNNMPHGQNIGCDTNITGHTVISFDIALDNDGDEEIIATNENLSVSIQCKIGGGLGVQTYVIFDSTTSNWFSSGSFFEPNAGPTVARGVVDSGDGTPHYESRFGATSASAATSSTGDFFIGLNAMGLGVNMFGHKCIAKGTVTTIP